MPQSLEQLRLTNAHYALAKLHGELGDDLKRAVDDLGLRIRVCGLASALQYLELKGSPELREALLQWLARSVAAARTDYDAPFRREAALEAQAWVTYLKRLVRAAENPGAAVQQAPAPQAQVRAVANALGHAPGAAAADPQCHPGLYLDKFITPGTQEDQKPKLVELTKKTGEQPLLDGVNARRKLAVDALGDSARTFTGTLKSPLALHLARTTSVENANICLHPLYGFVYLPGSGLKGMARAYAETVWLAKQDDKTEAWNTIEHMFGWAPNDFKVDGNEPWHKQWRPDELSHRDTDSRAGNVIFWDAFPTQWPELALDIAACHHPKYYGGEDAPGDWEDPNLVTFLVAKPDGMFNFTVSKRGSATSDEDLALARQWLASALSWLGAGAKTAAGYGAFTVEGIEDLGLELPAPDFTCELTLVSPAYLAGSLQEEEDCTLRVATLRGQLRWWWRTLHAGHLSTDELRRLEKVVWGSTETSSPVQIRLEQVEGSPHRVTRSPFMEEYPRNNGRRDIRLYQAFADDHGIERAPAMTTQPIQYFTYGVDVYSQRESKRTPWRYCICPGARWALTFKIREGVKYHGIDLDSATLLGQYTSALWLLCQYGGVGTRSRRALGSLEAGSGALAGYSLDECAQNARTFRERCGLTVAGVHASSPALPASPLTVEVQTPWEDAWCVLDKVGKIYQDFCQAPRSTGHGKHCDVKKALGLPKNLHGPRPNPIGNQTHATHTPPKSLKWDRTNMQGHVQTVTRFASPAHFHLGLGQAEKLVVRMIVLPSNPMPHAGAHAMLQDLQTHVSNALTNMIQAEPEQVLQYDPTRPPITQQPEREILTGVIVGFVNTRTARVRLSSGETVDAMRAKGLTEGIEVQVFRNAANRFEIVRDGN